MPDEERQPSFPAATFTPEGGPPIPISGVSKVTFESEVSDPEDDEKVPTHRVIRVFDDAFAEEEWFVVWERRNGADYPSHCFPGPCPDAARNPIWGNVSGPYTRATAERIVVDRNPR